MTTIKEQFEKNGFYGPVVFLTNKENKELLQQIVNTDNELDLMNSDYRCKSNVLFPWIDKLSRHPTIIAHVKEILGNNIHCWDTLLWIKHPKTDKFVSYHQDGTYWNFTPKTSGLTVWVTPTGATREMGCIKYEVGSHCNQVEHIDIKNRDNLLMRGQTATKHSDKFVHVECPEGSFLMHSPYIVHGSEQNNTNNVRIAIGFIYAASDAKPIVNYSPESTIMVNGTDHYNYMIHDNVPTGDWDTDIKHWRVAYDRQHDNYYKLQQKL
jgi:ectoine hydroxylase-related dioxygenase (phytanoyl-CoA dioxygenase family)